VLDYKGTIKSDQFNGLDRSVIAAHLAYRLESRVKSYHLETARKLAQHAPMSGNVAVVASVDRHTVSNSYRTSGDDSNGDHLCLIVRNGVQCTIFYVRKNQVNTGHLKVDSIVRL
jgi:hypothetical protein